MNPVAVTLIAGSSRRGGAARGIALGCGGALLLVVGLPLLATAALMNAVLHALAGSGPASALAGPAPAPGVTAPVDTPISCPSLAVARGFGPPVHTGIDLDCPPGTPVRTILAGTVHLLTDHGGSCVIDGLLRSGGYGTYAIVDAAGTDGVQLYYGHLQGYAVADGEAVAPGAVIGYEGTTGCSSGPHLHFEVRRGGGPVNPCPYLPPGFPTPAWKGAGCPLHLAG